MHQHDTDDTREAARLAAARLSAEEISAVSLVYSDIAGITRTKTVPTRRLTAAADSGVGMSPVFDTYLVDDSATAEGRFLGGPDGDLRLFPDVERLVLNAPAPRWATAPVDRFRQDGSAHPACQRRFARRMAERAAEAHGLELTAGFETEWVVVRAGTEDAYPCEGPAYGAARIAELPEYLTDVVETLDAQGVDVLQLHPEYSPGQFELSTAPEAPVAAADTALILRETLRGIGVRHGLRSSFAPVVAAGGVGNGRHLHLGLARDGVNLLAGSDGPEGMAADGEAFLAGVLDELPALLALAAPTPASYLRLVPSHWAGAYRCWGPEAREAALRLAAPGGAAANAEVKCADPAANPYLVVGGVIAAGLAGIARGARLPEPVAGDPAFAGREADRLPSSLDAAVDCFARSEVLAEALGAELHDTVIAVRRAESRLFAGKLPEDVAAATRWRY